jgi:hypothetical protein
MRILLAIAMSLLLAQYGFAQQPGGRGGRGGRGPAEPPPPVNPGFECFEHAETPEFPRSALQQVVDGTVWLTLVVTPQGGADRIQTQVTSAWPAASKLLVPAVEKAVLASKLKAECAGKTVAVAFRYEINGNPIASPGVTTRTEPRVMFIESAPELVTPARKTGPAAK